MAKQSPRNDAIERLSFVGHRIPRRPGESPRSFWTVKASGDYMRDCEHGNRLALEYLAAAELFTSPAILQWIVRDMPAEQTGVEVGFLSVLGYAIAHGREYAVRLVANWEAAAQRMEAGNGRT